MHRRNVCVVIAFLFLLPVHGHAQITFLGVSADYGTKIREPGISALALYTVNDQIDLGPSLTYYLPHKTDIPNGDRKTAWISVNLDGHYNMLQFGVFEGYGLMGLNFTNITTETSETIQGTLYEDKTNETKAGLNAGFGGCIHLAGFFNPFAQVKYVLGNEIYQVGFRFGVIIRIAEDAERDDMDYY